MLRFAILLAVMGAVAPLRAAAGEPALTVPRFVEETATSGIDNVYAGDWEYMAGGGVAAFDCNDDGFSDLLFAGGEDRAKFYRNAGAPGSALRFEAQESGLELDRVTGTYPLDIDGDGITDIMLLRVGENVVMRGLGGCRFERANEAWGFDGGDAWSTAFAATWEHGARWPTLAVGNYIDRREDAFPWGSCTDNWLHRPENDRRRFAAPLALKPSHCALSMLFTDWNRSGTPDLRISNDREYYKGGQEQLWRFEAGRAPALYTEADGWKRLRIWGMGIASSDLDRDGYPEYFLTSMADNKLQALSGAEGARTARPAYEDIAYASGVTAHRPYLGDQVKPSTAWHAQFDDVNNDGRADLFIAKGNVAEMPDFAAKDPNNLLLQSAAGSFQEAGDKAGVASVAIARGALLADLNLDGLLDLVVANRWSKAQIWRNASTDAGRWLQVKLRQDGANREAVGAWLEVKGEPGMTRREITVGGGHASGQSGWWHAGLGDARQADVRVIWPDGTAGEWQRLESNRFYVIERGRPARGWSPG
ncbi:CRTAC1 family protein [Mesorhizobium xinjiangense]|uniref:CRTAC1 family protein n=1 Tax=Mesorhizobium xinjiangense TaxID=2678685 RepID=UPI0012EE3892|nr:CRTAC1 family protein [Mesorhizobium xinjiangense]